MVKRYTLHDGPFQSRTMSTPIEPIAVPLVTAGDLVGCSRTQFKKIFVDEGLVRPVDLGARGLSVIVSELRDAVHKRAEAIRSGAIVPPIRSARGKKEARPRVTESPELRAGDDDDAAGR